MRAIGLHLRFSGAFSSVIDKAFSLSVPIFQAFFKNGDGAYISLTPELIAHYARLRTHFSHRIAHASYTINLANRDILYHHSLKKELHCAKKLQFSHLLFHPGSVPPGLTRIEALDTLVSQLNHLTKYENDIQFVLENSAHGKRSIGGDIEELAYIQARLAYPEKVSFCIDTAHAFVFGYSISQESTSFIEMVTNRLTAEAISVLHINDTGAAQGSFDDRHCAPGQGNIGLAALKNIMCHPLMKEKPLIVELPVLTEAKEREVLNEVRSWI